MKRTPSRSNHKKTAAPRLPSAFNRHFGLLLLAVTALAGLFYACLNPHYQTGFLNDDAIYVITAKDFWKTSLSHPLLGIKPDYPFPGLPLLLAPFAELVAPHWSWLEWITVLLSTATLFLLARLLKRCLGPGETILVTFLFAFDRVVAEFAGVIMPTAYYTAGILGVFLLTALAAQKRSPRLAFALGALLGWTALLRPEGFVAIFGVFAGLAMTRAGRRNMAVTAVPLAGWAAFYVVWFQSRRAGQTEFGGDLNALRTFWLGNPAEAFRFSLVMVQEFFADTWTFLKRIPIEDAQRITRIMAAVLATGAVIGGRHLWRESREERPLMVAVAVFSLTYFGVHLYWHVQEPRYMLPLIPFVAAAFVRSVRMLLDAAGRNRFMVWTVLAALAVPYSFQVGRSVTRALWAPVARNAPPWRSLEWLKDNSPKDARVTSNIAPSVDLYADRDAMGVITVDSGDEFLYVLNKLNLSYIVFREAMSVAPGVPNAADPNYVFNLYRRWLRIFPERFPKVFEDPNEQTSIYKVVTPPNFVAAYEKFIDAAQKANQQRYAEALLETEEAQRLYPKLASAHNLMGALRYITGDFAGAEKALLAAALESPGATNARLNLVSLYHRLGRPELEAEYLRQAEEINRRNGNMLEYTQNREKLFSLWKQGRSTMFFKTPHTDLYRFE